MSLIHRLLILGQVGWSARWWFVAVALAAVVVAAKESWGRRFVFQLGCLPVVESGVRLMSDCG